jgi:hypothetical protein
VDQLDKSATLADLFTRLGDDARELAQAEIALAKARSAAVVGRYRLAAIYFAAAGVLAFASLLALFVGLILLVSLWLGPGAATAIVVAVGLVLAAILALVGRSVLKAPQ